MAEPSPRASTAQLAASTALLVLGAAFAITAYGYGLGDLIDIGPGFFPFVLGVLLAVLAGADFLKSVVTRDSEGRLDFEWRRVACVCGALVAFALLLGPAGFVPAIFVGGVLAMLAEKNIRWLVVIAYSVGLTLVSYLIFVTGLGLPVSAFGW